MYRSPAPHNFPDVVYELYVQLDGTWEKVECATVYTSISEMYAEQLDGMNPDDDFHVRRVETGDDPFSGTWFDATDEARDHIREFCSGGDPMRGYDDWAKGVREDAA